MSAPSPSNDSSAASPESPSGCRSGQTVSIWRLGKPISRGPSFELYRARPQSLADEQADDYVIKLVRQNLTGAQRSQALSRMGRVAAAADSVGHAGMIPLLDAELDRPPFHLVQPWMAGGTFRRFVKAAHDISLLRCLHVFRQIAETLGAAHERSRVYLGLHPEHVLLGSRGRIVLTGWSDSRPEGQPLSRHVRNEFSGNYLPPEWSNPEPIAETAADVHALGTFVFWVLAGMTPPRNARSLAARSRARNLIRFQPACPAALSHLVREMLSPMSADRPTMQQVVDNLISIEIENLENPSLIQL